MAEALIHRQQRVTRLDRQAFSLSALGEARFPSTTRRRTSTSGTTSIVGALGPGEPDHHGIFLTMNYKPSASEAFASVEYIMRDVNWGWLIRYMHTTAHRRSSSWSTCTCSVHCCTARIANRVNCCGYSVRDLRCADGRRLHGYVLPWAT